LSEREREKNVQEEKKKKMIEGEGLTFVVKIGFATHHW
jgi:hypothetical protein